MSLKQKALYGFTWSLVDKLVNQLGYLAVTVYLARLIGPENFGLIGMLTIFMLLAESVISGGFSAALVQRSHQLTVADENTVFYINIAWGIAMYAVLYFIAPIIADFYKEPKLTDISRVLFVLMIINSFAVVVRAKLTINIDFKSQTIASTIATLFSSVLGVYLALTGYSYWALVWMLVLKAVLSTIFLWLFCRWLPQFIFSIESFRRLFKFGSNLMIAGFVATFVNNLYIALIGRYFNATQVGYFTQANNLSNNLYQMLSATLQGVTYPILTSLKEERERLVSMYKQLISITMLVALPLLVGLAAISHEVVLLFLGEDWLPVAPVLSILCFARAITPISAINLNILNAIGRSDLFLKVDLSKLPMTVAALLISVPYGIEAVAWAMVSTSVIAFFINAYMPGKFFGFGGWSQLKAAAKYIVAAAIMYVAVSWLKLDGSLWLELIAKILLGFLLYPLLLVIMRDQFVMQYVNLLISKARV
ncbi:lipopolysaccharide biosynthesis protein [Acinetobacter sp. GXMZU3951]